MGLVFMFLFGGAVLFSFDEAREVSNMSFFRHKAVTPLPRAIYYIVAPLYRCIRDGFPAVGVGAVVASVAGDSRPFSWGAVPTQHCPVGGVSLMIETQCSGAVEPGLFPVLLLSLSCSVPLFGYRYE